MKLKSKYKKSEYEVKKTKELDAINKEKEEIHISSIKRNKFEGLQDD